VAGRKVFTSGEILTAADVNSFLMDQSVMVFADSSARSSAIPTPSEGMVTFREDQDVVEVFDGSAFKTVGGLVAVKSAINTGPEVFGSVASGGNVAVPDLSITHEVSDPANKLIISAFFGAAAEDNGFGSVGIAVHDGTGLIATGDAAGSRTTLTAGGVVTGSALSTVVTMPSVTYVHTPGTGEKTYTCRAINSSNSTNTIYLNRNEDNTDNATRVRAVSSLVIQEVAV